MKTVFISSTSQDLKDYRQAAIDTCLKLGLHPIAMEHFPAMSVGATAGSKRKLDEAELYVGIYAHRYGYIEDGNDHSVTEIEFDYAGERGLDRLCFLVDPTFAWPPDAVDHANYPKLETFKAKVNKLIRAQFTSVDDFTAKLMHALTEWTRGIQERPGATSAILAQDPDDLTEKPRKLFGRDDLLREVRTLLDAGERVLLQGFGGMGKTALAATIAAQWIRDGKGAALWLKTGSAPTDALMEALARPLNAAQLIARETGDAKTQAMRAILRQSSVKLLILDDCWNGAALFALLKAVPSEMPVLLTARQRYSIDGKIRDVGELSRADSLRLLSYHADFAPPPYEVGQGAGGGDELCNLLGDHAFAVEIAGKVLKAQKWTPEKLLNDIPSAPHTLTLPLEFAEPGRENVAKLLETSLNALDDETRAVFRAFGAFFAPAMTSEMLMRYFLGKPKVSDEMLADIRAKVPDAVSMPDDELRAAIQIALSRNINTEPVEKALTTLELHGLVESIPAADNAHAHYRLHDLAYSYANAQNAEAEHHRALNACLAYIERYAEPNLANFAALRPELDNLLKAADWAFQIGRYTDVQIFPARLYFGNDSSWGFLAMQGFSSLALGLLSQAVEAATRQGDKQNQGIHLGNLGSAYGNLGKFKHALECFEQALKINREMDDKQNEGGTLGNLGLIYSNLGEAERAIGYLEQSLAINREVGDKHNESNQLGNLGSIYYSLRQVQRAIEYYEEALVISREISNKHAEGIWLGNLGVVYRSLECI